MPGLLTGDDRAQINLDISGGYVVGDVPAHGAAVFRADDEDEIDTGFNLGGAILVSDRWQLGAQVPIRHRRFENSTAEEENSGIGDFRMDAAFEMIPDWSYSKWRPKGFLFMEQVFPTGQSIYETKTAHATDSLGKGFLSTNLGFLFLKRFQIWDVSWFGVGRYSWPQDFDPDISVAPGFGAQTMLMIGVSPAKGAIRIGAKVGPSYEQPKTVRSSVGSSHVPYQLVWDLGIDFSYQITRPSSINFGYTDQTILGPTKNTSLMRTFALSYQYRWER